MPFSDAGRHGRARMYDGMVREQEQRSPAQDERYSIPFHGHTDWFLLEDTFISTCFGVH